MESLFDQPARPRWDNPHLLVEIRDQVKDLTGSLRGASLENMSATEIPLTLGTARAKAAVIKERMDQYVSKVRTFGVNVQRITALATIIGAVIEALDHAVKRERKYGLNEFKVFSATNANRLAVVLSDLVDIVSEAQR